MKRTKWFDARKFVPAHVGWYEVQPQDYAGYYGEPEIAQWDGKKWIYECDPCGFGGDWLFKDRFRGIASPAVKG